MTRLTVVAVQPELELGAVERNFAHVERLVRAAAAKHSADLIVLPEALGSPNVYHPAQKSVPRAVDGAFMQMLTRLSRELRCVISGGALSVRRGHAYGTYIMTEPDGATHLHDKDQPTGTECYDYRGGDDDGITQSSTWAGATVGLVSGMEWTRSRTARRIRAAHAQVVIGGQCWPWTPLNWRGAIGRASAALHADSIPLLQQAPPRMARMTGAPVVMASLVGPVTMRTPYLPGVPFHTEIIGQSMICDASGTVLAHRGYDEGEGWICAEIELDDPRPSLDVPTTYWSVPVPPAITAAYHATNVLGRVHYTLRHARRGFPWQQLPSADVPDEWPASPPTDVPSARTGTIRRLPAPSTQPHTEAIVTSRREVSTGVVQLTFGRQDGKRLPSWEPGAHIDVVLPGDLVRQYSLCGDPDDPNAWTIAVLLEPTGRGGSAAVHGLQVGSPLRLRGPRNTFALSPARKTILIAGGIGITPIKAMAEQLAATGADWQLHYGGRSRATMAYVEELESLAPDRVRITAEDENGPIDLEAALAQRGDDVAVYCCGPEGLLNAVTTLAPEAHVERFAAVVDTAPRRAFTAELATTGVTVEVPAHQSLLDVARQAGALIDSSCQDGICGSCRVSVLDGVPEHRDSILTAEERRSSAVMYPCVSRAAGTRIVLDA